MNATKTNIPSERLYRVRLLGTGAAVPTKQVGPGVTVTRTGAGVLRFSFNENPGTFVGVAGHCFGAATPGDMAGHTLLRDTYVAPTSSADGYVELTVADAADAADDLEADEYLDVTFAFSENSEVA